MGGLIGLGRLTTYERGTPIGNLRARKPHKPWLATRLGEGNSDFKPWWSGKGHEVIGVGVMLKEELCEMMVEVSDIVMAGVLVRIKDVPRLICGHALQTGRRFKENENKWRY